MDLRPGKPIKNIGLFIPPILVKFSENVEEFRSFVDFKAYKTLLNLSLKIVILNVDLYFRQGAEELTSSVFKLKTLKYFDFFFNTRNEFHRISTHSLYFLLFWSCSDKITSKCNSNSESQELIIISSLIVYKS